MFPCLDTNGRGIAENFGKYLKMQQKIDFSNMELTSYFYIFSFRKGKVLLFSFNAPINCIHFLNIFKNILTNQLCRPNPSLLSFILKLVSIATI